MKTLAGWFAVLVVLKTGRFPFRGWIKGGFFRSRIHVTDQDHVVTGNKIRLVLRFVAPQIFSVNCRGLVHNFIHVSIASVYFCPKLIC